MTKKYDDIARKKMIAQFNPNDFKYNNIPIKEMVVERIDCKVARPYISTFHYSKTMPDSTRYAYAGFLGTRLCGIVCYGMGCNKQQFLSIIPDIKDGEYLELTRLWCPDDMPRNTESKLISESLRLLPKAIKLVLSFSDESKGHVGIIYQATNWYYLGINNGGKMLITKDKKFTPIHDLSDELLEQIIEKYQIEVPEVYKHINRTGCMGCPYGSKSGNTEKELSLISETQKKFVCEYFKESYKVLGLNTTVMKQTEIDEYI